MSRVTRRAGTKALVCADCQRRGNKSGRTIASFRGRPRAFQRHMENHHGRRAALKLIKAIIGDKGIRG